MSVGHLTELRADMSLSAMHISLVRTGPSWRTRAYLRNICTRSLRCRIVHVMPYGVPFSAIGSNQHCPSCAQHFSVAEKNSLFNRVDLVLALPR